MPHLLGGCHELDELATTNHCQNKLSCQVGSAGHMFILSVLTLTVFLSIAVMVSPLLC